MSAPYKKRVFSGKFSPYVNWRAMRESGSSLWYEAYLCTDHWRNVREHRLSEDLWRCHECGSVNNLQVHHKSYERLGNERLEDLVTLCGKCHRLTHDKERARVGSHATSRA